MFGINIENLKQNKISYVFKKALRFSFPCSKCGREYEKNRKKIWKEEESNEILKIISLINDIKEYYKVYYQVWRKHESKI